MPKAKITCNVPAANPQPTPIFQARSLEPIWSNSRPPPSAPAKLPSWWLMKAMPWIIACQRRPNISTTDPKISGPTPSHRKPMQAAKTSVPIGVGGSAK